MGINTKCINSVSTLNLTQTLHGRPTRVGRSVVTAPALILKNRQRSGWAGRWMGGGWAWVRTPDRRHQTGVIGDMRGALSGAGRPSHT
eukprot:7266707-Prymnesium_polylepis.1